MPFKSSRCCYQRLTRVILLKNKWALYIEVHFLIIGSNLVCQILTSDLKSHGKFTHCIPKKKPFFFHNYLKYLHPHVVLTHHRLFLCNRAKHNGTIVKIIITFPPSPCIKGCSIHDCGFIDDCMQGLQIVSISDNNIGHFRNETSQHFTSDQVYITRHNDNNEQRLRL